MVELESLLPTGSPWPCCLVYVTCLTEGGLAHSGAHTYPLVEGVNDLLVDRVPWPWRTPLSKAVFAEVGHLLWAAG